MGCLKKIINLIIFVALAGAFFWFDGPQYVKERYEEYTSPPKEVIVREETNFGNLAYVPDDYKLQRSLAVGRYKKITATHNLSKQKIVLFDTGSSGIINQSDFYSKKIDDKLYELLDKTKSTPIGFSAVEVTQRGTILAKGKIIPFVNFKAKLKTLPFITVSGTIGAYNTTNKDTGIIAKIEKAASTASSGNRITTKVVLSSRLTNNYSFDVTNNFIKSLSFIGVK